MGVRDQHTMEQMLVVKVWGANLAQPLDGRARGDHVEHVELVFQLGARQVMDLNATAGVVGN